MPSSSSGPGGRLRSPLGLAPSLRDGAQTRREARRLRSRSLPLHHAYKRELEEIDGLATQLWQGEGGRMRSERVRMKGEDRPPREREGKEWIREGHGGRNTAPDDR
eukprot:scaffold67463_cov28-Tisochrysis_lutea.AAC.1